MVKIEYKDENIAVHLSKDVTVKELDAIICSLLEARNILVENLKRAAEEGETNLWECHD
jgi:hypothetical protein